MENNPGLNCMADKSFRHAVCVIECVERNKYINMQNKLVNISSVPVDIICKETLVCIAVFPAMHFFYSLPIQPLRNTFFFSYLK